jgi:hypothetical protein
MKNNLRRGKKVAMKTVVINTHDIQTKYDLEPHQVDAFLEEVRQEAGYRRMEVEVEECVVSSDPYGDHLLQTVIEGWR